MSIKDIINELCDNQVSIKTAIVNITINHSKKAVFIYRLSKYFYSKGFKILYHILNNKLIKYYGIFIGVNANVDLGLILPHPTNIVIGDGVKIGPNVRIFQNVTLGVKNIIDGESYDYPIVQENAVLFSGAKVIGNVTIGSNSKLAANSVTITDVLPNSIYGGIPSKLIKKID